MNRLPKLTALLFFILLGFAATAQPPIVNRSNSQITVLDQNLFSGMSFRPPVFADTTAANAVGTLDSCGKIIFTYNWGLWYRWCEGGSRMWRQIIPGGSASTDTLAWTIGGNDLGLLVDPNPSLGTINNSELNVITNNTVRLIVPENGINRRTSDSTKCLIYDTITKRLYYTDCGSGRGVGVDTIYRTEGKDSIQFTIGGRYHSIKDSSGGGSVTLQDAFDADPTASPQINARGNDFAIDSTGLLELFSYDAFLIQNTKGSNLDFISGLGDDSTGIQIVSSEVGGDPGNVITILRDSADGGFAYQNYVGGGNRYVFPSVTGTNGQILKMGANDRLYWAADEGDSSQWTTQSSTKIYYLDSVGIGRDSARATLDVKGDLIFEGQAPYNSVFRSYADGWQIVNDRDAGNGTSFTVGHSDVDTTNYFAVDVSDGRVSFALNGFGWADGSNIIKIDNSSNGLLQTEGNLRFQNPQYFFDSVLIRRQITESERSLLYVNNTADDADGAGGFKFWGSSAPNSYMDALNYGNDYTYRVVAESGDTYQRGRHYFYDSSDVDWGIPIYNDDGDIAFGDNNEFRFGKLGGWITGQRQAGLGTLYNWKISTDSLTKSGNVFQLPDTTGVPVMSINGSKPDKQGRITVTGVSTTWTQSNDTLRPDPTATVIDLENITNIDAPLGTLSALTVDAANISGQVGAYSTSLDVTGSGTFSIPGGSTGSLYYKNSSGNFTTAPTGTSEQSLHPDGSGGYVWKDTIPISYDIYVQAFSHNTVDATETFFGQQPRTPNTTAGVMKVYFRRAGTITGANIYSYASSVAGSNEGWLLSIRLNNTTDYNIATVSAATAERIWNNQSMSVPIAAGDYIEIKQHNVTWATNPTAVTFGGNLTFKPQ